MGKQTRKYFKTKDVLSTSRPLQLVHMDLCGPSRTKTPSGESYFLLIIDDFSRMTWVAFLKYKSEALEKFKIFKALAENQTGCKLKSSDQTEEVNSQTMTLQNYAMNMG